MSMRYLLSVQSGFYSGWFRWSGLTHVPHSDYFYILGLYGIPGILFFCCLLLSLAFSIRKMPRGFEKLYARAILTYLLVMGLSIGQNFTKHYWVFIVIILALHQVAQQHEWEQQQYYYEEPIALDDSYKTGGLD